MGYQPTLDGLRALSVGVVLLYHAGFSWIHGGFFGVEVFFVVSGFLITSLLIEEAERDGRVALGAFWLRRARRLLPALCAVLLMVAIWAALAGSAEQVSQLRRDIPWSVFYLGNWGQILGDVPYFAGEPALLRHLWSLAVEEQWYLVSASFGCSCRCEPWGCCSSGSRCSCSG
jgi:peptidoglycan/LPS O-acetylase OafA/YrhL